MSRTKILFLSSTDISGGAALATYRLTKALCKFEIEPQILVQKKSSNSEFVIAPQKLSEKLLSKFSMWFDMLPLILYPGWKVEPFYPGFFKSLSTYSIKKLNPDIIHLGIITRGFINLDLIQSLKKPVVWTLHDSWAFTGGCHLPKDCDRYEKTCGSCPILGSKRHHDLSYKGYNRKASFYNDFNDIKFVSPSKWLAQKAANSSLLRNKEIDIIPNGVDIEKFFPSNKNQVRKYLSLPQDKKIILFAANFFNRDKNKGYDIFKNAIGELVKNCRNNIEVVLLGASKVSKIDGGDYKINNFGYVQDEHKLTQILSAADVLVVPSRSENFPLIILESMACGTPVVAFNVGGIPEIIDHHKNGYLANAFDTKDLSKGILQIISNDSYANKLSENCISKIRQQYDIKIIAREYYDLYNKILSEKN